MLYASALFLLSEAHHSISTLRTIRIDKNIRELENNCMKYIAGWQNSPWLKNQLVLFLDEDLKGELNGYDLHYSFEKGLEFTKKEECE